VDWMEDQASIVDCSEVQCGMLVVRCTVGGAV